MATTSKIKEIISVKEWDGQYGKMYSYSLHMENWEYPKLNKTKKDAFKVWDEITYEEVEPWKKWKEVKQSNFKKSYNPEANNRWAMVWLAYKIAFDKAYNWEDDFNATIQLANRIFEEAMSTYSNADIKTQNEQPEEEAKTPAEALKDKAKTEEYDLPF